jgi:hypothetical protein
VRKFIFLLSVLVAEICHAQSWDLPLNDALFPDLSEKKYSIQSTESHPNIQNWQMNEYRRVLGDSILLQRSGTERRLLSSPFNPSSQKTLHQIFFIPIIGATGGLQSSGKTFWDLSGGGSVMLNLGRKFSAGIRYTYHRSTLPEYADSFSTVSNSIPGYGAPNRFPNALEYRYGQGFLAWEPGRHAHLQLGYGKHFFGDGHRSLLLSDNSPNYPYARFTGKLWRFRYVSMMANFKDIRVNPDDQTQWQNKFAAIHYLSWNILKKLNISIFEAIVFQSRNGNRASGIEVNYLNPVIFFRPVEYANGSADNALFGASIRWSISSKLCLYGQVMLDEFLLKEVRARSGWQDNKQAGQLGFRLHQPFGIKGLHLLGEVNLIRPYTYYHKNTLQNYGHMNQSLAHPGGANLREMIGRVRYFRNKWMIQSQITLMQTGLNDSSFYEYGQNIYGSYFTRPNVYGNKILQGVKTDIWFAELTGSRQLLEAGGMIAEFRIAARRLSTAGISRNDILVSAGIRCALDRFYWDR